VLSFCSDETEGLQEVRYGAVRLVRLFAKTHQQYFLDNRLLDFVMELGKSNCSYRLKLEAVRAVAELLGAGDLGLIVEFVGEPDLGPKSYEFIMNTAKYLFDSIEMSRDVSLACLGVWAVKQLSWKFMVAHRDGFDAILNSEEVQEFIATCEAMDNPELSAWLDRLDECHQYEADAISEMVAQLNQLCVASQPRSITFVIGE
jgi:hypothetical protein